MANGRCNLHGGKQPSGIASSHYKGAGRSRYIPRRWAKTYAEAAEDPDLLSLRPDLARLDAQIDEAMRRLPDEAEEAMAVAAFFAHFGAARRFHVAANDREAEESKREEARVSFWQAFEAAALFFDEKMTYQRAEEEVTDRLATLTDARRKLVETETKRLSAAASHLHIDTMRAIVWALLDILRREVPDRETLARVQTRFIESFRQVSSHALTQAPSNR